MFCVLNSCQDFSSSSSSFFFFTSTFLSDLDFTPECKFVPGTCPVPSMHVLNNNGNTQAYNHLLLETTAIPLQELICPTRWLTGITVSPLAMTHPDHVTVQSDCLIRWHRGFWLGWRVLLTELYQRNSDCVQWPIKIIVTMFSNLWKGWWLSSVTCQRDGD